MKAKIKATGEIIEVYKCTEGYSDYHDAPDELSWFREELIFINKPTRTAWQWHEIFDRLQRGFNASMFRDDDYFELYAKLIYKCKERMMVR